MNIGLLGILGLIFITLKLTSVISWSWWLVLLPLYGSVILWVFIFITALIVAAVIEEKGKR